MCQRVIFDFQGKSRTVAFKNPYAKLPVLLRNGQIKLLPWGRRQYNISPFPLGSSICLKNIKKGDFDAFFPKPVKLPIRAFLIMNKDGTQRWFHLPCDKWIQGVVIKDQGHSSVFIVSLDENGLHDYLNWPRILVGGKNYLTGSFGVINKAAN